MVILTLGIAGCTKDKRSSYDSGEENADEGIDSGDVGTSSDEGVTTMESDGGTSTSDGGGTKFDTVQAEGGNTDDAEGGNGECTVPPHSPCDSDASATPGQAIGLGCPGELPFIPTFTGDGAAIGLRSSFGNTAAFNPREGSQYVVLSSGSVADVDVVGLGCSSSLGAYPAGGVLPAPIVPTNVGAQDCYENPALVGTGDCSNTIQDQFNQGGGVGSSDYTELRLQNITVPNGVTSLSYDLAFFSYEYQNYYKTQYNDMFVGWLESMNWTGNISFDEQGAPVSLNAGFLDYRDAHTGVTSAMGDPLCPVGSGCHAEELHGTCLEATGAGTKWLTSTAEVVPGETITLVFAVFDLSDGVLDSFVFLDNFQWGCEGGPPSTTPAG